MAALPGRALQYHPDVEDRLQKNIILLTEHTIICSLVKVIQVESFIPTDRKLRVTAQKILCYNYVTAYRLHNTDYIEELTKSKIEAQLNITNIKSSLQWLSLSTSSS